MTIHLDLGRAQEVLKAALETQIIQSDPTTEGILEILYGTHKTYKYILVTALLAKATDERINPLSLQAGADLMGAYDARSLCHKVFVPFERECLSSGLGGSNEPYLNKPARFKQLSLDNAVRAGSDRHILSLLIRLLSSIRTSEEAFNYLGFALRTITNIAEERADIRKISITTDPTLVEVYSFIVDFVDKSFEGETSAIVVGTLEKLYRSALEEGFTVECHKVNQSGSSSNEIGDIDIYKGEDYCYSIEVKDKAFSAHDLEHAFKKIIENGGVKGAFICGPRASFDEDDVFPKLKEYSEEGFLTLFMDIYFYSRFMLFQLDIDNKQAFFESLMATADEMNAKDETIKWIKEIIDKNGY